MSQPHDQPTERPTKRSSKEPTRASGGVDGMNIRVNDATVSPGAASAKPSRNSSFLNLLIKSRLLEESQLDEAAQLCGGSEEDPERIAGELVARGWITHWQSARLLGGNSVFYLGKYLMLDKLGEGGMGAVYKARQGVTQREVALKVMATQILEDPDSLARFRREVRAAAALHHPNIVTTFDADCAGKNHFLVMEYVAGCDLSEWLARHERLPMLWICECIRQAALGLEHAFERGLIHRDLKPANLMVVGKTFDDPPVVKILDMGLARFQSEKPGGELTAAGDVFGTPQFISPEQAKSAKSADIRSDIFSLGCTLFKLLTGQNVYQGTSVAEQFAARFAGPPRSLATVAPTLPAGLIAIVDKALAANPDDRYQTPLEFSQALGAFIAQERQRDPERTQPSSGVRTTVIRARDRASAAVEPPAESPARRSAFGSPLALAAVGLVVLAAAGVGWFVAGPGAAQGSPESPSVEKRLSKTEPGGQRKPPEKNPPETPAIPPGETAARLASADYVWSTPKNLGPAINAGRRNLGAALSADERLIVFARDGALWSSERPDRSQPFPPAQRLPESINKNVGENSSMTGDGLLLVFSSTRPETPSEDIWMSARKSRSEPFGEPFQLPGPVNSFTHERVPYISSDGLTLLVTTNRRPGTAQVVQYTRGTRDEPFGHETILPDPISTADYTTGDWLSADGLVIVTTRMRAPPFESRFYVRASRDAPFGPSQAFGGPFEAINPGRPWLSPDGMRMYFHSRELPNRHGDLDLWVSERVKR